MTNPSTERVDAAALADLRRRATEPDAVRALLAERFGVARDADLATITTALDRALAERPFAGPPEGSELVDSPTLADLRADAERGRSARRDGLLAAAIRDGRIPPASRSTWATLLDHDPNAEAMLAGLRKGTIPVAVLGHGGDTEDTERDPFGGLWADERTT